ncbi:Cathepsin L-1-like [Tropilaelaps mercedesae]|uniref:Cathepsin L-1-like n=1 Tax=Tropilaelaps mercedesae TaxID=418985 RepID=A0A1V9XCQ5_9ACAR|nr:Cathepsin L-1-like [Tropilaelaps mercedesae]
MQTVRRALYWVEVVQVSAENSKKLKIRVRDLYADKRLYSIKGICHLPGALTLASSTVFSKWEQFRFKREFYKVILGFVPALNASEIPHAEVPDVMTSIEKQEYRGSCYAFKGASTLEADLNIGVTYVITEQDIIDCSYKKFRVWQTQ